MSRNGSGTYNLPAGNPVVSGTTISSTWANTTLTDIGTALTNSLASDGQTVATGSLQMGNNKITNLANGTASADATNYSQLIAAPFLQNGTGAVATTVQTKLQQYVSIKDFGAIGDGTTNDATAIQAAIDAVSTSGGGQVLVPAGDYSISTTTINMATNVSLVGQGQGSNGFSAQTRASRLIYSGTASAIKFANCACSNISNLTIDCSGSSGTTVRGIWHDSSWLSVLENLFINGVTTAKGYGILMTTGANGSQHNDLRHIECADGEIRFAGTSGADQVTTTTINTCRGLQYYATNAQITFINATAEGFVTRGFYFTGTGDSQLLHCDIEGAGTNGIEIDPTSTHSVYINSTIWQGFTGATRVSGSPASELTYGSGKFLTSNITTGTSFPTLAWGNNSPSSYIDFYSLVPYCDNGTGGAQAAHLQIYRRIGGTNFLTEEYKNFYRFETSSSLVANTPFTLVTLDLSVSGQGGRVKVQISGLQAGAGWFEVSRECVVINNLGTLAKTDGTALAVQTGGSAGAITFTISGTNLLVQASHGSATPNQLSISVEYDGVLQSFTKV
jgi:hypothetical protein